MISGNIAGSSKSHGNRGIVKLIKPNTGYSNRMSAQGLLCPVPRLKFERLTTLNWENDFWFRRFDTILHKKVYSTHNYRPQPTQRPHTGFSKGVFGRAHVGTNPPPPGPEATLGDLGQFPWELVYCIIRALDLRSLEHLRTVSRQLNVVVLSLPEYQVLTRHAPQLLRSMLSSWAGAYFTLADVWRVLTTQDCEDHPTHSSGDGQDAPKAYRPFGAFVYLLTCTRVCMDCLRNDLRYTPMRRHDVDYLYGMESVQPWLHDPQGCGGFSLCMDEVEVDPSPSATLPFLQLRDVDPECDLQVVDRLSACALAIELHGSAEALWEWTQEANRWVTDAHNLILMDRAKDSWVSIENQKHRDLMEAGLGVDSKKDIEKIEEHTADLYRQRELALARAIVPPPEWLPRARVKEPRICRHSFRVIPHTPSGADALYKASAAAAAQRVEKIMAAPAPPAPAPTTTRNAQGVDEPLQPDAVALATVLAEKYRHLAHESGWEKIKQLYGNQQRYHTGAVRLQFLSSVRVPWINLHASPLDKTRPEHEPCPASEGWGIYEEWSYWKAEALEEQEAEEQEEAEKENARQWEMHSDWDAYWVSSADPGEFPPRHELSEAPDCSTWNQDGIQVEYGAHCNACRDDMHENYYEECPMFSTATYAYHLAEHGPVVDGVHQSGQSTTG